MWLAALCVTGAIWLWRPPARIVLRRLALAPKSPAAHRWLLPVVGCLVAVMVIGPSTVMLVHLVTLGGTGWFAVRQWKTDRARRSAALRREATRESIGLLAAELRSGGVPQRALNALSHEFEHFRAAAHAASLGADVSALLRAEATRPGAELLTDLAGAWLVAERTGAPLSTVLERIDITAHEQSQNQREVSSGVAPARATGRLMAVLPLVGLGLGSGTGSDPITVLTRTVPGALLLAAGAALACAGISWVDRIASSAERDV